MSSPPNSLFPASPYQVLGPTFSRLPPLPLRLSPFKFFPLLRLSTCTPSPWLSLRSLVIITSYFSYRFYNFSPTQVPFFLATTPPLSPLRLSSCPVLFYFYDVIICYYYINDRINICRRRLSLISPPPSLPSLPYVSSLH